MIAVRFIVSGITLLSAAACSYELPSIEPERFSCPDDAPFSDGTLPCPASHRCESNICVPRLDCSDPNIAEPGCEPNVTRCEADVGALTSAVRCKGGLRTITSTVPLPSQGGTCACPDNEGLVCAAFAEGRPPERYPLFILPSGVTLPTGSFDITGEVLPWRRCVHPCGNEYDCPAGHSCRAAPVLTPDLLADPTTSRHTIGVCYPDRLVGTSTDATAELTQPDPEVCYSDGDCETNRCFYQAEPIEDHVSVPAGSGWGPKLALIGRCADGSSNLAEPGRGCTNSSECRNGLCGDNPGRCLRPCGPDRVCPGGRECRPVEIERESPGRPDAVYDTVFACP